MSKPLVVILAYYFPPSTEIGAARPHRFYKYLKTAGYDCRVITASEQNGADPPDVVVVHDRMQQTWERDAPFEHSAWGYGELLARKCLMPGATGLGWSFKAAAAFRQLVGKGLRPSVLLSTFPPDGVLLSALLAANAPNTRWIMDFRDPPTFGMVTDSLPARYHFVRQKMERRSLARSAAVIANTRAMAATFQEWLGPDDKKLHVIWNGFDGDERPVAAPLQSTEAIHLAHVGGLYLGRNPNLLIASLDRLRRRRCLAALKTRLSLVGEIGGTSGTDWNMVRRAVAEGWLDAPGPVSKKDAQAIAASVHGQVLLQPGTGVQVPAKLFEQICIGRPILAVVPRHSDAEYILSRSDVPYACLYVDDQEDVVDSKLLRFLDIPPTPVPFSPWFSDNFDIKYQGRQLAAIIDSVH